MSRMTWALVAVVCGMLVGGLLAYVQIKDLRRVSVKLDVGISIAVALAILSAADKAGWMVERDKPGTLSLKDYDSPEAKGGRARKEQ